MSDCLWSHELQPARLLCPWNSPGKNTGMSSHSLVQGIFLTQESNPGFLHCRQIFYCLSHQGSPKLLWNRIQRSWILNIPDPQHPSCYVLSHFSSVWLCDSEDCSPPGSSVQGILQAIILEWIAIPSPRGSSRPRDQTCISYVSGICRRKPYICVVCIYIHIYIYIHTYMNRNSWH